MPELPEVETSCRGIRPHIVDSKAVVVIRQPQLRWKIPADLINHLKNVNLNSITRRAKNLLLNFETGTLLMHIGMSGSVRICPLNSTLEKHVHFDLIFENCLLLYTDPRRFGAVLWLGEHPFESSLVNHLGPEPLSDEFTADKL